MFLVIPQQMHFQDGAVSMLQVLWHLNVVKVVIKVINIFNVKIVQTSEGRDFQGNNRGTK